MADYMRPGDAAKRLGVSPSGLRRLAGIYADTYGDLPRDEVDNRLWPVEAVERLEVARSLVAQGRAKTIKEAFQHLDAGVELETPLAPVGAPQGALGVLMGELKAIREELAALREDNAVLRSKVEALPAPQVDNDLLADLERRNRYLEGELKRRDEQPAPRRPWWKVWLG